MELEPLIEWERAPDDSRFLKYVVEIRTEPRGVPNQTNAMGALIPIIDHNYWQIPAGLFQPNVTYYVWVKVEYDGFVASENGIQFTTLEFTANF